MSMGDIFDLSPYLSRKRVEEVGDFYSLAGKLLRALQDYGVALVYDPRYRRKKQSKCINLMEEFFTVNPNFAQEIHQQVHIQVVFSEDELSETPLEYLPTEGLPALRSEFHWSIGMRPTVTQFPKLNEKSQYIPDGFSLSNWKDKFDGCGDTLLDTVQTVAELVAIAYGLPMHTFSSIIHLGPHSLISNGHEMDIFREEGTLLSSCHCDSSFLSIQPGNRFLPGINIWTKNGRKVEVMVPDGCLLIQIGKQMEWMTAGGISASKYETIVSKNCMDNFNVARAQGRNLWSVSSKLYAQVATDILLEPVDFFAGFASAKNYPMILAGSFLEVQR